MTGQSPVFHISHQQTKEMLPPHWDIAPLWSMVTCNDEVLSENSDLQTDIAYVEISGVSAGTGITNIVELPFSEAPSRARRKVQDGDVLISTVRTYLRAIAPVIDPPDNMIVSTGFAVLRPRTIVSGYLGYAVQAGHFIAEVIARSVGVSYPAINSGDLIKIKIPHPSREEQAAITAFLDGETAKIDALVDEQKRLIDLLKEKRQAVISYAVTKGLNPDVPMKDTGIEWLGEVPGHWDVARLKYIAEVRGRIGFRGYTADDLVAEGEGALALGGANLSDAGRLSLDNRTYLSWEKYEESPEIKIQTGDVLIGQRGTCGRPVVIDRDIGPATINPSLVVLKELRLHPQFVTYWLMGDFAQKSFDSYLNKTAVPMLSQQQIGNLPISFPELEEQQQICMHIDRKLEEFHDLLKSCQAGIVLLEERRAALVSAAVTGKIDVRNQHHCVEAAGQ